MLYKMFQREVCQLLLRLAVALLVFSQYFLIFVATLFQSYVQYHQNLGWFILCFGVVAKVGR